jgi:3-keto-5-aminohexanoate cleavage enzyme
MPEPVIIICSINGMTKGRPNVPTTPAEVTACSLRCIDAGASIIHNHIDIDETSGPAAAERYLEGWSPVWQVRPDALFYPTANFGAGGTLDYTHLVELAKTNQFRIGLCDIGPLGLGYMEDGVPRGSRLVANGFDEVADRLDICRSNKLGAAMQVFDPSGLRTAMFWWRAGKLPVGGLLNLYFYPEPSGPPPWRAHYSLPPTAKALDAYLEILEDCPVPWAASVIGGDILANDFCELVLDAGGHINIGLEPYRGAREPTNEELIREAVAACERAGRPVASCDRAATMLELPQRTS